MGASKVINHIKQFGIKTSFVLLIMTSLACKSAHLGPDFPIQHFGAYKYIVIATVDEAVHSESGYNGLESFKITIKKCLQGDLEVGDQISGKAKKEQPYAVCPVHLTEQSEYLLLLTKSAGKVKLSRFSFPVISTHKYYNDYVKQIEAKLN